MRLELGAPWEALLLEATTRRELPLGFTRQAQVGPRAVRDRVEDGNVDDGMVVASLKRGVRSLRVTPIGAIYLASPRRGGCGLSQFEVEGRCCGHVGSRARSCARDGRRRPGSQTRVSSGMMVIR